MPRTEKSLPPGMYKRGRTYYSRFRAGGRYIRRRLSTDFETACKLLHELQARADRADYNLIDNDYAWADLKEEFLQLIRQTVRGPGQYEQDLAKFEEFTRVGYIREIDHRLAIAFRSWRLKQGVTPRTINRQLGTVNNLLNRGVEWRRIGSNPLAGLRPLKHDAPVKQRRALTTAEVQAIFEASPPHLRPVWKMLMTTGIRRSEIVNLKFADVDFARKSINVRAAVAKNHKSREIPLDDEVLEEIAARYEAAKSRRPVAGRTPQLTAQQRARFSREHVFVTAANTPLDNNLLRQFYVICKQAGIEGAEPGGSVDIHSLRVTFISLAIEHGANPKAVQAIVGHSSLTLTMNIYAKTTDAANRAAIAALPFARLTPPEHVLSLAAEHKVGTTNSGSSQQASA